MGKMKAALQRVIGKSEPEKNYVRKEHDPIQYSDQTCCRKCGKVWDTNDAEPPECE